MLLFISEKWYELKILAPQMLWVSQELLVSDYCTDKKVNKKGKIPCGFGKSQSQ